MRTYIANLYMRGMKLKTNTAESLDNICIHELMARERERERDALVHVDLRLHASVCSVCVAPVPGSPKG